MTFNSAYLSGIGLNLLGVALVTILGLALYLSLKRGLSFGKAPAFSLQAQFTVGVALAGGEPVGADGQGAAAQSGEVFQ